jgi:hypothetical protein
MAARKSPARGGVLIHMLLVCLIGCASTQSRHEFLGASYPARPANAPIEVFTSDPPRRPYVKTARLDVHLEKTGFMTSNLQDALAELKKQAREAGSDAIIEITEKRSQVLETMVYHVTAYGIRYIEPP